MRYASIDGYKDYVIYEDGRVYSNKTNKFLKTWKGAKGYLFVSLTGDDGRERTARIHRLVALAFIPNPLNKPDVNHKDENKENNHVSNLEWMTKEENNAYGTRSIRGAKSRIDNPKVCTKVDQYDLQGNLIKRYDSIKQAKEETKVKNISKCCLGERKTAGGYVWRYVKNEIC